MAAKAGISDVMRFVGRLAHERFATALQAADVFISVPSVDATAVSLLEAMASGCPVIISSLPSAQEWIKDDWSGLVVAPRDVSALTTAMLHMARDESFRKSCEIRALATARRYAGFSTNMEYVAQIFKRLVKGQGPWPEAVSLPHLMRQSGGDGL